jgi:hypothetical protein
MKKIIIIIGLTIAIAGLFFATPIMGREARSNHTYYGSAYAGGSGGGGI